MTIFTTIIFFCIILMITVCFEVSRINKKNKNEKEFIKELKSIEKKQKKKYVFLKKIRKIEELIQIFKEMEEANNLKGLDKSFCVESGGIKGIDIKLIKVGNGLLIDNFEELSEKIIQHFNSSFISLSSGIDSVIYFLESEYSDLIEESFLYKIFKNDLNKETIKKELDSIKKENKRISQNRFLKKEKKQIEENIKEIVLYLNYIKADKKNSKKDSLLKLLDELIIIEKKIEEINKKEL